jgi:hypothetical protein
MAALICCLAITGCIPVRMQVGKHYDGAVVDKGTGVPVVGAQVMYRHQPNTAVLTDARGTFTLERQSVKVWRPLLPVDYFGFYHYPLAVRAQGYAPATYEPAPSKSESVRIELSPVR